MEAYVIWGNKEAMIQQAMMSGTEQFGTECMQGIVRVL